MTSLEVLKMYQRAKIQNVKRKTFSLKSQFQVVEDTV
jgi:hypothetical protein